MLKTVSSISNVIGALNYKGTWNANSNVPVLSSGVGTKGDYYVVSTAGSTNLDGTTLWGVGDWAVFNGSIWQKVDGGDTSAVTSLTVTGLTGYMYANNTSPVTSSLTIPVNNVAGAVPNTVYVISGTGLSGGGQLTGNVTVNLANTAVTAATYGNATSVSQITVDAQGRITSAANVGISIPGMGTVTNVATGTGLTGGPITGTGTISLANTTVTAGSYGNASTVGNFTVNAQGQLTAASNTSIAIDASAITSGTLGVTRGGTGAAILAVNGVLYGNGTSALGVTAVGATGQVLIGNTGAAPSWANLSSNAVTSITFGTTGLTPSTASNGAITVAGTLVASNGGTGQSTYTVGDLLYASSTSALSRLADVATGSVLVSGGVGVAPAYSATPTVTSLTASTSLTSPIHNSSTTLSLQTGGTTGLYIDASQNVGIGTTSPSTFSVNSTYSTQLAIVKTDQSTTLGAYYQSGVTQYSYINAANAANNTANPLVFSNGANTERMRIDSSGNVGIGTSSPSASAILDVQSTTKGVRFPNMTTAQKTAITPAAGTVVFDTTLAKLCVYSGSAWQTITSV